MDLQYLDVEIDGTVATVWLNRPPVNAVNIALYDEIQRVFANPDAFADDVRVMVLAGRGAHFCGGNDLGEFATMTPDNASERMWHVREAFFAIQDCPVPVIGAIHGTAVGTGLALAASCDYLIAAADAVIGLPEITVGVMGGARHLGRWVTQPTVRRAFFTGKPLTAAELYSLGAIQAVVPPDQLLDEVYAEARLIAAHSPTAMRVAKRGLNAIEHADIKSGYTYEQRLTALMSGHPDSKEALHARKERRPPEYAPRQDLLPPPGVPAQG
ncbi:enoyl-CoA hydratase-related protein [Pseudofrankia inefficax]|uniref:Enoyl-CoA hydratase/isomerase n=1 Tax=Pseudofrankia inefficax (strain DSM 45817 / CECT 9037 / DDB 130130 / EuI1c) TaxID=298654 RepID=E3J7V4_PSEI1|nr:enoyl-CoA hydratase-related protein [Pseudofrankia inefficax]ADP80858.1 Enoyl-CoA hydratase/isomerase [Pseudofrankia inefficax]